MSRRRGSQGFPFFALLLIVTGVLLLLQTLGVVPWGMWIDLWRLWPVLLIAAGVAILLGRGAPWLAGFIIVALLAGVVALAYTASDRFGGGTNTITLEEALDETERLKATLDVGAGVITLGSLSSESEELFRGEFRSGRRSGVESTFTRTGDTATLKLERKRGAFFFGSVKEEWTLDISRAVTVELAINAGAVELRGDLSALDVRDLVLKAGAST
ncbi:MAG: hypothetical protein HY532_08340, partial [Chloroflexi bacterium]|nr:hypothetical protein [Chloroflexota bacterium]